MTPASSRLRRAVFLDRDGVINEDRHYVCDPDNFVLLPGVGAGLRRLQDAGWLLVVVTNQSGIGRGIFSPEQYDAVTRHMIALLRDQGVTLDAVYHCPHAPADPAAGALSCDCRKPAPGMILRAANDLGVDLSESVMCGDSARDIEAGRRAGVRHCVLIHSRPSGDCRGSEDAVLPDLVSLAEWLT